MERVVTPVDQHTGLPLPLSPSEVLLEANPLIESNWHHHAHPRRSPLLQSTGGIAVRNARLQLADIRIHNAYHRHFDGPPLPRAAADKFRYTIMACAGYVPDEAIDLSREDPKIVPIDHFQRNRLWLSGELKISSVDTIRKFMQEHILKQDLSHLRESIIDEFLHTPRQDRRVYLGHLLLAKAIEQATEPTDLTYRLAWKEGKIHPAMPPRIPNFVSSVIGRARRRAKLVTELRETVRAKAA